MQEVAASQTAMQEVADSQTAMQEMIASQTAVQEVRDSPTADSLFHFSDNYATALEAFSGINTGVTGGIDSIAASQTAMQEVITSQPAMQKVAASQTAMQEVIASQTAMQEVADSQQAMQEVVASQPAMQEVANSQSAMQEVIYTQTAMQEVANSQTAMQEVANSQTAVGEILSASDSYLQNTIVGSATAAAAFDNSNLEQSGGASWTDTRYSTDNDNIPNNRVIITSNNTDGVRGTSLSFSGIGNVSSSSSVFIGTANVNNGFSSRGANLGISYVED
jgi:antitoxin component HigA of HigAB toxin-antitoxin module